MVADLSASGYLVDGVALAATGVRLTHDGAGLWSGFSESIGVSTAAGVDGGVVGGGVVPPFTLSTMYQIRANGFDAVWESIVALRRRCKPRQTVTLTRQMPDPDGTDANTNLTTTARRQADRIVWYGSDVASVDIDWLITGGPFLGASEAIAAVGAVTVKGDVPTVAITATLSAGAVDPVVANSGNGYLFRYVGTVPAGGVLVDVRNRTATRIADSVDVSSALRWSKADLFQLDPGGQTITTTDGTVSFTYLPAYL